MSKHPDKVVLFDAFGTVIRPIHGIIETYHEHGKRFGSQLGRDEIKARFTVARREIFGVDLAPEQGRDLQSSDGSERESWQRLIACVFSDVEGTEPLFVELWDFFADAKNWTVYSDVEPCLNRLVADGFRIGIASNFDSRLLPIVESLEPLRNVEWTFCSSLVGFRKPDRRFYESIAKEVGEAVGSKTPMIFMVGDDVINDVEAPLHVGWNTFHVDRKGTKKASYRTVADIVTVLRMLTLP